MVCAINCELPSSYLGRDASFPWKDSPFNNANGRSLVQDDYVPWNFLWSDGDFRQNNQKNGSGNVCTHECSTFGLTRNARNSMPFPFEDSFDNLRCIMVTLHSDCISRCTVWCHNKRMVNAIYRMDTFFKNCILKLIWTFYKLQLRCYHARCVNVQPVYYIILRLVLLTLCSAPYLQVLLKPHLQYHRTRLWTWSSAS